MNMMGILQQFGRSLMLPTIVIPFAAILLFMGNLPWELSGMSATGDLLRNAGHSIFTYLPFVFAVGVALGLTENAGSAGMSSLVGYFLFHSITKQYAGEFFELGVSGGIMIGVITALAYHRFKDTAFPEYIQFFGGSRFVHLITGVMSISLSALFIWTGPHMQNALIHFSDWVLKLGGFGAFLYGFIYRLMIPSGLHHILNNFVWFQLGHYERPEDGHLFFGDLTRFFAGDSEAGIYMAGLYPIMMFALPAIAFAIIHEAREDLKPKVKATFLIAAFTSFLTGVTEPIEFAFLFAAPYLFIVHAVLSGISMAIAYYLQIYHGFSFSAGFIDYIINFHLASTNSWLLLPIGLAYFFLYYYLFRWAIRRFQIPTPGREEGSVLEEWAGDIPYRSPLILQALGGKNNIILMESCITRLRLTLKNDHLVDMTSLKHLGAVGTIRLGAGNVQVVFGTYSELIREEIMKLLRRDDKQVLFCSPVQGKMIPIEEVPDQIFSSKLVGNGIAFYPDRGELVSPVKGKVIHLYPTMHAIGIKTEEGLEVLLHIGIDTSTIPGKIFTSLVKEGDHVEAGQLLIRFNLQKVRTHGKSTVTPMVITNSDIVKTWGFAPFMQVKKGQASVMSVVLKEEKPKGGDFNHD